jgi:hypothetical protein
MTVLAVRWALTGSGILYENAGWASMSLAPFQRAVLLRKGRPWAVVPGRGGFMPRLFRAEQVAIVDVETQSLKVDTEGCLQTKDGIEVDGEALIDFKVRDDPDSLLSYVGRSEIALQMLAEAFLQGAQAVLLQHHLQTAIGKAATLRSELTAGIREQVDRLDLPFHGVEVMALDFEPLDREIVAEPRDGMEIALPSLSGTELEHDLSLIAAEAEANLKIWTELVTRMGEVKDEFDKYLLAAYEPWLLPIVKARAQEKIEELQADGTQRTEAADALFQHLDSTLPHRKKVLLSDVWMTRPHAERSEPGPPEARPDVARRGTGASVLRNEARVVASALRTMAVPAALALALLAFFWNQSEVLAFLRDIPTMVASGEPQSRPAQEQASATSSQPEPAAAPEPAGTVPPAGTDSVGAAAASPSVSEAEPAAVQTARATPARRPAARSTRPRAAPQPAYAPAVYTNEACAISRRRVPDYGFMLGQTEDGRANISYMLYRSPAHRAGARSGDVVQSIDGLTPSSARAAACLANEAWARRRRFEVSLESEGQHWSVVVRE